MVFGFFKKVVSRSSDSSSLVQNFKEKGYRIFGGMENAPEKLDWGVWVDRIKSRKKDDISDGFCFSRLGLLLAMHDFNFPLGFGRSVDQAFTDGRGDCGIDGVALAIGNTAIYTCDDVCRIIEEDPSAPVRMLFHKAKYPDTPADMKCDEEISNFVQDILFWLGESENKIVERRKVGKADINERAKQQWGNYNCLRKCFAKLERDFNPEITILFSADGHWTDEEHSKMLLSEAEAAIKQIFPNAIVRPDIWGKEQIEAAAEYARVAVNRLLHNFSFVKMPSVELPDDWNSVATKGQPIKIQGFIGHVPAQELLRVFMKKTAAEGAKIPALDYRFYRDSPRHYISPEEEGAEDLPDQDQEHWNRGVREMERSLTNDRSTGVLPGQNALIGYGHNGVVVVARKALLRPGTKEAQLSKIDSLELVAPQVVNGAQTCFALHRHWNNLAGVFLPLKLIVSANYNVKDYIIMASNTQHPVDDWDMFTRRPEVRSFQRKFRHRFISKEAEVWLQRRRNKPFEEVVDLERTVLARDLLEATVSCFYNRPHMVTENPTQFLDRVKGDVRFGKDIFCKHHLTRAYQAIAWLLIASKKFRKLLNKDAPFLPRNYHVYALWRLLDEKADHVDLMNRSDEPRFLAIISAMVADINQNNFALTEQAAQIVWDNMAAGLEGEALTQAINAKTARAS